MANEAPAKSPRLGAGTLGARRESSNFNPYGQGGLGLALSASTSGTPVNSSNPLRLSPVPFGRSTSAHKRTSSEPVDNRRGGSFRGAIKDGIEKIWNAASPRLASVAEFGSSAGPVSPRRAFFQDATLKGNSLPVHLQGRSLGGILPNIRAIIVRPLFLLLRRSWVLSLTMIIFFIFLLGGFSSSPPQVEDFSSFDGSYSDIQNQTKPYDGRMNRIIAAADDYFPQRAKDLIPVKWSWSGTRHPHRRRPEVVGQEDVLWMPRKQRFEDGAKWMKLAHEQSLDLVEGHHEDLEEQAKNKPLEARSPRRDGRALIVEGEEHPIPMLMRRGRKRWEALKAKQSKTFSQAVKEYVKRYGRRPPKGFDRWSASPLLLVLIC